MAPSRIPGAGSPISSRIGSHPKRPQNSRELSFTSVTLMKAQLTPTHYEFAQLAKRGNVIPLFAEFIADGETPVSAFKKLDNGGYSFLFESTETNDVWGRFACSW